MEIIGNIFLGIILLGIVLGIIIFLFRLLAAFLEEAGPFIAIGIFIIGTISIVTISIDKISEINKEKESKLESAYLAGYNEKYRIGTNEKLAEYKPKIEKQKSSYISKINIQRKNYNTKIDTQRHEYEIKIENASLEGIKKGRTDTQVATQNEINKKADKNENNGKWDQVLFEVKLGE